MSAPPVFELIPACAPRVPIVLSVPHAGTAFPEAITAKMHPINVTFPEDTDWFVDILYDFAPKMGVTMLTANYSRYVIDLNRAPNNTPLYSDARQQTALVPTTTFAGAPLYAAKTPDEAECATRLSTYYQPYYAEIEQQLTQLTQQFGHALLFDAHSIRRHVPTIHTTPFPCLILGDNHGASAPSVLSQTALACLQRANYTVSHNTPFSGGQITRHFGNPARHHYALQLEMAQDIYMDEATTRFSQSKAEPVRQLLMSLFHALIEALR